MDLRIGHPEPWRHRGHNLFSQRPLANVEGIKVLLRDKVCLKAGYVTGEEVAARERRSPCHEMGGTVVNSLDC